MAHSGSLTLIQMNDIHGYLEMHPELFWRGGEETYRLAGGLARIATVVKQARQETDGRVLALDCGDTIHGTYEAVQSKGEVLVPILNAIGYDAMTGHWDFAYGPEQLKRIDAELSYPMLALNCYDEGTDERVFEPYRVCEVDGLRVGIAGIAATIVDKTMPPHFHEGIRLTLGRDELPGIVETLRGDEQVDLVVVISHLGFPQEMKLASEVPGIDVLLSAHTHNRLYEPARANETTVIQSGCHGSFLGRLDIEVEDGRVGDIRHRLITIDDSIEPDAEVQALVDAAVEPHAALLNEVLGETRTALNRNRVLECTMDNFLLQALLEETGSRLAFSNGWRYGAPVPAGPVTLRDLWNIIPVNPPVSTVELTGEELLAMMEENLEHTFSRDPYQQMGGYLKRCMGLNLYVKLENPPGHRICEMFVGGERVEPGRTYTATFVTEQGVPSRYGRNRQNLDTRAIDALQGYLARHSPVEAPLRGSVVAV